MLSSFKELIHLKGWILMNVVSNFAKFCASVHFCFHSLFKMTHCILLHWTASADAINSDKFSFHFYSVTNIFWFSLLWLLRYTHHLKVEHWISKYMFFNVSLIFILMLISHLNAFSSVILCFYFFSLSTLLRLSMAKSKISLGKCHTILENMWIIFKYLLILIFYIDF